MTRVHTDMAAYYAKRAAAYEKIYAKLERQADLAVLQRRVGDLLRGHRVLELACGTGYWTTHAAQTAESVLATDLNPEMLEVAKAKNPDTDKVRFALSDAFNLHVEGTFTACFAGFWWSHVKREEQTGFLEKLRGTLGKDILLVMMDNVYVEGSSTPIARTDAGGNTYQICTLDNGERYEVLKNFPSDSGLKKKLGASVKDLRIERLDYFWMLSGRLK